MGFVQRRLVKLVLRVVEWPRLTIALCVVALLASVVLAKTRLGLSTDHNELMTPQLQFFKDYLDYIEKFPENEAFVVILEPQDRDHPPAAKQWTGLADELAAKLRGMQGVVKRVDFRVRPSELGDQALLLDDWNEIRDETKDTKRMLPLLKIVGEKPGLDALVLGNNMTERLVKSLGQDKPEESKPLVDMVARTLDAALDHPVKQWQEGVEIPELSSMRTGSVMEQVRDAGYFVRKDRTAPRYSIVIMNVYPVRDYSKLSDIAAPLEKMRKVVKEVAATYPEFHVAVTGRQAMEADEMITSDHDTKIAEILGLSLVFVALLIFLRSLWMVVAAEICLGVGIGWTFGWATLSVGRLNLLSLVFVIALIGIGMDYLIQILTRYRYEKKRYGRPGAIWARVFRFVSPPISTACAGAAGAFFVSALTDFRGAAELGIIAGGGLLLCLLSGYTLLPALLTLFPAKVRKVAVEERYTHKEEPPKAGGWRLIVPALWILIVAAGLLVSLPPEFNPNLIELQAQGLESVQMVHKISEWDAVVMTNNLGKLRELQDAMTPMPHGVPTAIGHTESVIDMYDKQKWLAENAKDLDSVVWFNPPDAKQSDAQAAVNALTSLTTKWKAGGVDVTILEQHVAGIVQKLGVKDVPPEILARLSAWQRAMLDEFKTTVAMFRPKAVRLEDLPPTIREHLVSNVGPKPVYALYIYPREDAWDAATLERFVKEVRSRVPEGTVITGIGPQLYESTRAIHKAFLQSTVYALVLIFVLVWLDMRKISQTLLAISVLALGLPMLLLVMWVWRQLGNPLGISGTWNFANFFGLPILIGAGHEYGVFMVHRYKEVLHDPKRVWRTWDVSDRALLLCAIVVTCSFGFLMIAEHRGLRSLGWVMAMGSACIYLSTLLVLRPILQWRLQQKDVYSAKRLSAGDQPSKV